MANEEKAIELGKKHETPCHGVGDCEFEARQAALIDKVTSKGTWDSNPCVFVYDFELVK